MKEIITMSHTEQRRTWVLTRVLSDELTVAEAAEPLGLTERSIRRLRARLGRAGPAGLVLATGSGLATS